MAETDGRGELRKGRDTMADGVLVKQSKRYDNMQFLYWWDIAPDLVPHLDEYDALVFHCKDTGRSCKVAVSDLKPYLRSDRQTTRGDGNWGIRVLKRHRNELSFEPGAHDGKWLFMPVTWTNR